MGHPPVLILLHGLLRLRTADPGFDVDHTIALDVRLPTTPPAPSAANDPYRRISGVLGRLPAVESVSCARYLPLTIMGWRATVHMETAVDVHLDVDVHPVGPRYLETMRIPLLRGRDLAEDDARQAYDTGKPTVVNETLARRIFGLADPIGRRLTLEKDGGDQVLQIVGVARDSKLRSLNEDSHSVLYLPELTTSFVVRVAGPAAAAVRSVVNAGADSERGASVQANPMRAQVAVALAPTRIGGGLLGGLSALGLVLAMTGLYAVVNHAAKRRRFEFGVRIALGATSGVIMRLILRQGLSVVAAGCAVGGVLAFVLARILSPLVAAGQGPIDLPALGAVGATLALTGLAASVGPARRAARVDPVVALRHE